MVLFPGWTVTFQCSLSCLPVLAESSCTNAHRCQLRCQPLRQPQSFNIASIISSLSRARDRTAEDTGTLAAGCEVSSDLAD